MRLLVAGLLSAPVPALGRTPPSSSLSPFSTAVAPVCTSALLGVATAPTALPESCGAASRVRKVGAELGRFMSFRSLSATRELATMLSTVRVVDGDRATFGNSFPGVIPSTQTPS